MGGVDAHHGEGLAGTSLAIGEDGAVVPFETINGASFTNFLEHVVLGVVVAD